MYEEVCYNRNYLVEVICRLDFASEVSSLKKSMPKDVFDVVKKHFPIAEPRDLIGTELSITPTGEPAFTKIITKQWVFLSKNRMNQLAIDAQKVVFSIKSYSVFEDLRNAIVEILDTVMNFFSENQGKRLGLRYVNNIPLKEHSDWIEEKFITALVAHKDDRTTRLVTTLEYADVDKDLNVRLLYGYNNPDYPAIMKREEFLIDIDSYSTGIIYQEYVSKLIDDMHFQVQDCFEKMITDNLREAMK